MKYRCIYIKKEKYDEKRKKYIYIYNIIKLSGSLAAFGISKGFQDQDPYSHFQPCAPGSLATFGNFKRISRSRPILIFPTMCNLITRASFVPRGYSLPFAHVHQSKKCVFSLLLHGTLFSNDLFDESW
jgi:hypothetical protein